MVENVFRQLAKRSLEVDPPRVTPPVPYLCILPVLSTLMLMFLGAPPPKKKRKNTIPPFLWSLKMNCSLGVKQEVYEVVEK